MVQRSIDLTLSVVASAVSFLLSWPYWRTFSFWPESPAWWRLYFAVGFVLAVFVFYVFFRALRTLFVHEGPGHGPHDHAEHAHPHAEHAHADGAHAGLPGHGNGRGGGTQDAGPARLRGADR